MTFKNSQSTYKHKILGLLAQHKYLTSKQIWDLTGAALAGKTYNQTQVELNRLKKAGLIRLELVKGDRGHAGLNLWVLAKAGARIIDFADYGKHFERGISRYQFELHKLEIDLEEQIGLAQGGWKLIKSFKPSPAHRLPETTEQFYWLCQVLTWQEYQRTGQLPPSIKGPHTLMVPLQANHHLAYLPNCHAAVIFILPHPRATDKFWQAREKEYGRLAQEVPVYGVFPNKDRLHGAQQVLEKYNITGAAIGQVSALLTRMSG